MTDDASAQFWESPFGIASKQKQKILTHRLRELTALHEQRCAPYGRILASRARPVGDDTGIDAIPFIPVRLFKQYELRSIAQEDVFKVLTSSGTTSQVPSRIFLDRETATAQTKALVRILQDFLGKERRPMLLADTSGAVASRQSFSARGAGIIGISSFGRDHVYALNEAMEPDLVAIETFAEKHGGSQPLVFGFTFMVWEYLVEALRRKSVTLKMNGVLLHSGGWKKLIDRQVDASTFKSGVTAVLGIRQVHNFYGMVEQVGTIFVECEQGVLHAPALADVIVRDPLDWHPLAVGETGVLQVLSMLPTSYPGHSLLTEDMGTILGEDDCPCGRLGRYFTVSGRIPAAELRGCSDTHVVLT